MFIRKGGGRKFFISKGGGRWRRQSSWKGLHPASTYQTGRRKGRGKGTRKRKGYREKEEKGMKRNGTRMGPSMLVKEIISSHAICKLIITINTVNMPGTQHQLIKLAGEKKEERGEEKEEHILVKVIMRYHVQYVNLSILSTSTATYWVSLFSSG